MFFSRDRWGGVLRSLTVSFDPFCVQVRLLGVWRVQSSDLVVACWLLAWTCCGNLKIWNVLGFAGFYYCASWGGALESFTVSFDLSCVQIRLLEILFTFAGWGGALEGSTVSFDRVCMPMPVFAARRIPPRNYLENFIERLLNFIKR